jgi:nucleotide-binding universal stress UspA family protein
MAGFTKILVPTDFSSASAAALKYACALADAVDASLCILHTVENTYPVGAYSEYYTPPQEFIDRLDSKARTELDAVLTDADKERYRATLVLRHGAAAQEIIQYLQDHPDMDLVVMATHGRGGVARLMMGSVADKVVRTARCPVLTIRVPEAQSRTNRAA